MDNIYILKYSIGDWECRHMVNLFAFAKMEDAEKFKVKIEGRVAEIRAKLSALKDSPEWMELQEIIRPPNNDFDVNMNVDPERWEQAYNMQNQMEEDFWKKNSIEELGISCNYSLDDFNSCYIDSVKYFDEK